MTSPAGTVQRMRGFLADAAVRKTAETQALAQAYAAACREANDRVALAADYVKKNMLSEALNVAEAEPPLLDVCAELDFVGVERWRELCHEAGLTVPDAIDSNALTLLNNAYGSGLTLEPLLKEYRRAVREKNTKRSVRLLRRIAEKDSDNKQWAVDLRAFELKRAGEIQDEASAAERVEDVDRLGGLLVELRDAWSVPLPPEIGAGVEGRLRRLNAARATVRGTGIIARLSKAYAALDTDLAGESIAEYESLLKDRDFSADPAQTVQYEEAAEWWRQERDKRQREAQFEGAVAGLRDAVERADIGKIAETLNLLARFDHGLPETLERRARGLLDAHAVMVARIRKRRAVVAVAVVIATMAGMGGYVVHEKTLRDVSVTAQQLDTALQRGDLAAFDEIVQSLQPKRRIREAAQVRERLGQRTALVRRVETMRETFQTAWETLDAIQKDGFQESAAVIDGLVERAKASAQSADEQGRLTVFVTSWSGHKAAVQANTDAALTEALGRAETALMTLGDTSGMPADTVPGRLGPVRASLGVAETVRGASPALVRRLDDLRGRVNSLEADVTSRCSQLASVTNSTSLNGYLTELATYVRAFPNDPMSKRLAAIPSLTAAYLELVSHPFASTTNAFWGRTTAILKGYDSNRAALWSGAKQSILSLGDDKTMVELWMAECEERGGWLPVFFQGVPKKTYEDGMPVFSGSAYVARPRDREPSFGMQTFKSVQLRDSKRMSHCDYVAALVSAARLARPSEADSVLLEQMNALARNGEIPGLLRLRLLDFLVEEFAKVVGEDAIPEWSLLRRELKSIDQELSWLCLAGETADKANRKAIDIIDREFISAGLPGRYAAAVALRKAAVTRDVRFVGFGDLLGRGTAVWLEGGRPAEAWVVRRQEDSTPRIFLAHEVVSGTNRTYKVVTAGEPLFAPGDGRTTRELLGQIKSRTGCRVTGRVDLGGAWPDNLRE